MNPFNCIDMCSTKYYFVYTRTNLFMCMSIFSVVEPCQTVIIDVRKGTRHFVPVAMQNSLLVGLAGGTPRALFILNLSE